MVLIVHGVVQEESPPNSRALYQSHPVYRDSAIQLASIPTKMVGPLGLLYVQQRELAVTIPHDSKLREFFPSSNFCSVSYTLYFLCQLSRAQK